jgi:uncharacterized membrane protein YfcA
MAGILELSVLILVLGARGFTRTGIPWSSKRNIRGRRGKVLGILCVLFGILGIGFAYWGTPQAGRRALESVGQGVVIGFLGAILILGGVIQERLPDDKPPPPDSEFAPPS